MVASCSYITVSACNQPFMPTQPCSLSGNANPHGDCHSVSRPIERRTVCTELASSAINIRRSSSTVDYTSRPRRQSPPGAINNRPTTVAVYIGLVDGRFNVVIFAVTRRKLTKFVHGVLLKWELRSCNLLCNANVPNEGGVGQ